jgi:hypothetical protein
MISLERLYWGKMNQPIHDQPRSNFHQARGGLGRVILFVSLLFGSFSIPTTAKAAIPTPTLRAFRANLVQPTVFNATLADENPPPLPASFFGEIHLSPNPPLPGTAIEARIPTLTGAIAATVVRQEGTTLVYSLDVPGDNPSTPAIEGAAEGDMVTFSIGGINVAVAPWHSGTNTRLDFTSWNVPPPLPASFYGEVRFSPSPPEPGTAIEARIPGVSGPIAATVVMLDGASLVYALDVPGDLPTTPAIEGGTEGVVITFSVGGIDAGAAPWHSGTHTRLDLVFSNDPPPLPASFFGEIHITPSPPDPGTTIEARIPGVNGVAAATVVVQDGSTLIYALDVPGDFPGTLIKEGGVEGDTITFSLGGREVATAPWHAGTHTRLDFNSFAIILQPGWNLVSFNLHPANSAPAQVLSSIAGSYDQVYAWNAARPNNNWLLYSPSGPPYANTLAALDEKTGFWINIILQNPVTLYVTGSIPTTTTINLSTTAGGWNLTGFPSATGKALPGVIPAEVPLVYAYHAGDAVLWKLYDRGAPPYVNNLTSLAPGWGYWVYATASIPWIVNYP